MDNNNARDKQVEPAKLNRDIKQSGLITSSQRGLHPKLDHSVRKHLQTPWKQPFHQPTVDVFQQLVGEEIFKANRPIILDSGCGTGSSSIELAALFPDSLVIGVDRSHVRLSKSGASAGVFRDNNLLLIRAELSTLWRLMLNDGVQLHRHYLLYPNPYPKPGHLARRWHGHPVFPQLLRLAGALEMRCNWDIYADEFARAVNIACQSNLAKQKYQAKHGISRFEQKYVDRDQSLYSVTVPKQLLDDYSLRSQVL